jgi:cystathionine beta-lyase/cystathionine gamma-synthase
MDTFNSAFAEMEAKDGVVATASGAAAASGPKVDGTAKLG